MQKDSEKMMEDFFSNIRSVVDSSLAAVITGAQRMTEYFDW
jgi:hypothetical protein